MQQATEKTSLLPSSSTTTSLHTDPSLPDQHDIEGWRTYIAGLLNDFVDAINLMRGKVLTREFLANVIGKLFTGLAMIPQAIFATLLTDKGLRWFFEKYNITGPLALILRITIDAFMFITTLLAKFGIVDSFATPTWKNIGTGEFFKIFDLRKWSKWDYLPTSIKLGLASIAALTFAYLSYLGLELSAPLLKEIDLEKLAMILTSIPIELVFEISSWITNILGFPNILNGTIALLTRAYWHFLETPDYRNLHDRLQADIWTTRLAVKQFYKTQNNIELRRLFKALLNIDIDFQHITSNDIKTIEDAIANAAQPGQRQSLLTNIVQFGKAPGHHTEKLYVATRSEFLIKHLIAGLCVAIAGIGFWNFGFFTNGMLKYYSDEADLQEIDSNNVSETLGYLNIGNMLCLAFVSIYMNIHHLVAALFFGRDYAVDLLSRLQRWFYKSLSSLVCLASSMPVTFQIILKGGNLPWLLTQIFSGMEASILVEFSPLKNIIEHYPKARKEKAIFLAAIKHETNTTKLEEEGEEEDDSTDNTDENKDESENSDQKQDKKDKEKADEDADERNTVEENGEMPHNDRYQEQEKLPPAQRALVQLACVKLSDFLENLDQNDFANLAANDVLEIATNADLQHATIPKPNTTHYKMKELATCCLFSSRSTSYMTIDDEGSSSARPRSDSTGSNSSGSDLSANEGDEKLTKTQDKTEEARPSKGM